MSTKITLTETQRRVLESAADHPLNEVVWFPDTVKGGARATVLQSLASKGWINEKNGHWFLAAGAQAALERNVPLPVPTTQMAEDAPAGASGTLADQIDECDPTEDEMADSNDDLAALCTAFDERYADVPDPTDVEEMRVAEQSTTCTTDDATTPHGATVPATGPTLRWRRPGPARQRERLRMRLASPSRSATMPSSPPPTRRES